MVTIEKRARELFEKGENVDGVVKILSEEGISTSPKTIRRYRWLWKKGCTQTEYQRNLGAREGFRSYYEYLKARKADLDNRLDRYMKRYMKDPHFEKFRSWLTSKKGAINNNPVGLNENPYYLVMVLKTKKKRG